MRAGESRRILLLAVSLLAIAAQAARAQVVQSETLPGEVAHRLVDFYNAPGTIRLTGHVRLPGDAEVSGDVAVLDGSLALAGRVRGELIVLNGDLVLEPGARVDGGAIVVGGNVLGAQDVLAGPTVVVYRERLRYRRDGDRIAYAPPRPPVPLAAGRDLRRGRLDITMASQGGYNRIEGLPIAVGPRFLLGGSNPTRLESLLLYRTAAAVPRSRRDVGHILRLEQFVGGRQAVRLRILHRSEIAPIESWGLSELENSLSTFLLHRDYRDYYARQGWAASLQILPPAEPWEAGVEFRAERHGAAIVGNPWTLPVNGPEWRLQPQVAEGALRTLSLRLGHDSRNTALDPYSGWLARVELELGLGGSLSDPLPGQPIGIDLDDFVTWFIDVRRYARTGPASRLSLRVLAAGPIGAGPLPPQRQHALGGIGSLPAYDAYQFDCGARAETLEQDGRARFPAYGCDRVSLVQLEYQAAFPFARGLIGHLPRYLDPGDTPGWVAFFNAGRAWTDAGSATGGRDTGLEDLVADAGLGLRFGRFGLYATLPLSGGGRGLHFFMRAGPRL